jgi:hypothetical protein
MRTVGKGEVERGMEVRKSMGVWQGVAMVPLKFHPGLSSLLGISPKMLTSYEILMGKPIAYVCTYIHTLSPHPQPHPPAPDVAI